MSVTVEPMRVEDAERCAELETVLFPTDGPWPASAFVDELRGPHVRYVVVRETPTDPRPSRADDRVVGYAGIALLGTGEGAESEVHTIGVDPAAQRRGIGRALLDALLREADSHGGPVFLEVRTDNEPAIEMYRRAGFEIVGTRRNYYRPSGADAYTMTRPAPTTRGGHP